MQTVGVTIWNKIWCTLFPVALLINSHRKIPTLVVLISAFLLFLLIASSMIAVNEKVFTNDIDEKVVDPFMSGIGIVFLF